MTGPYGEVMTDWNAIAPGAYEELDDDGRRVRVEHRDETLFVVRRNFEGGWQQTAWVHKSGDGWRVSRQAHVVGDYKEELDAAIRMGIELSRPAPQ